MTSRQDLVDSPAIDSFIMDAEVVAIGAHEGELLPFQTLSNRSRKDVNLKEVKVKVGVFAFDLMYLDGKSLLKSSFRLRRKLLHERFPPFAPENPLIARFAHVKSCEANDPDDVERFFEEARQSKCEGISKCWLGIAPEKSADDGYLARFRQWSRRWTITGRRRLGRKTKLCRDKAMKVNLRSWRDFPTLCRTS